MNKKVYKVFFAWDYDEETKWLNLMSRNGYALIKPGLISYEFEDCEPGEYNVRLQYLMKAAKYEESMQHIESVKETGAEYIGAVNRWVYFRKKSEDGPFKLLGDYGTWSRHINSIIILLIAIAFLEFAVGFEKISLYINNTSDSLSLGIGGLISLIGLLCVYIILKLIRKKQILKNDGKLFE